MCQPYCADMARGNRHYSPLDFQKLRPACAIPDTRHRSLHKAQRLHILRWSRFGQHPGIRYELGASGLFLLPESRPRFNFFHQSAFRAGRVHEMHESPECSPSCRVDKRPSRHVLGL